MVNGQPQLNPGMEAFQGMVAQMMSGNAGGVVSGDGTAKTQSKCRLINTTLIDLFKAEPLDPTTVKRYIQIHLTELAKRIRDFPTPISLMGLAHLLNCCRALTSETHGVPFLCIAIADKTRAAPRHP